MDSSKEPPSLYERLGEQTLERAVYLFYDRILADSRLKPFFKNIDTRHLARHQHHLLMTISGGPGRYSGRSLRDAHRKLVIEQGLSDEHFDAVAEVLRRTLEELEVEESMIGEMMAIVETTRNDILNR
jgi:truncated hemoglobin YjbI